MEPRRPLCLCMGGGDDDDYEDDNDYGDAHDDDADNAVDVHDYVNGEI